MSEINMNFSDELLEDIQQDFDDWEPAPEFAPPPPAGTYQLYISQIRDIQERDKGKGKRLFAILDFRIVGGQYDDRVITFQRINNVSFTRRDGKRTSFMLDLIKSAGVQQAPKSNNAFALALKGLADRGPGSVLKGQLDWEGACASCRDKFLLKATASDNIVSAKELATPEDWDGARTAAMKAKNYRAFPVNANGTKQDTFVCQDCKEEVRAQVNIRRFMPV